MRMLPILSCVLFLSGCSGIIGIPLEITSWSPAEEWVSDPEGCVISVTFNRAANTVRTEEAFTLAAEGIKPPGIIEWEGTTMIFVPYHPLEAGREYTMTVGTAAEDRKGNSLAEQFVYTFFTGREEKRPAVICIDPPDQAHVTDIYRTITITFDAAVDTDSFLSSFSLTPAVRGFWEFKNGNTEYVFTPTEAFTRQTEYTITVEETLRSDCGYTLQEEFESRFYLWNEQTRPEVVSILSEDSTITVAPSPPNSPGIIVNRGWEKDRNLRFRFSEEVDADSAETCLSVEPEVPFTTAWDEASDPDDMLLYWDEDPEWKTLYRIELSTALSDLEENMMEDPVVFYLYVDGASSRPPRIERVNFVTDGTTPIVLFDCDDSGNCLVSHIILDTSSGTDITRDPFYFDYYIRLADGAVLPFFAFPENFLIRPENNCVSIVYRNIQVFNPADDLALAADPKPTPEENQAVVRLIVSLTDAWDTADLLTLQVYGDLEDSLGNEMEEDWMWELFDEDN